MNIFLFCAKLNPKLLVVVVVVVGVELNAASVIFEEFYRSKNDNYLKTSFQKTSFKNVALNGIFSWFGIPVVDVIKNFPEEEINIDF